MNHGRRGKALIFNHEKYKQERMLAPRYGTNLDRDELEKTLKSMNFDVNVYNDLKWIEIEEILENVSEEDHADVDCLLIVALTHGDLGILEAFDGPYKIDKLWFNFMGDKCPSLAGKPKIFLIQACQGHELMDGVSPPGSPPGSSGYDGLNHYMIPTHADVLIVCSTVPDFVSWRTKKGSPFIMTLCSVLEDDRCSNVKDDFLSLLTRVSGLISKEFESNCPKSPSEHGKKQIPCITSMLTKKIFF